MTGGSRVICRRCDGRGYDWRADHEDGGYRWGECPLNCDHGYFALPLTAAQALEDTCRWGELAAYYDPAGVPDLEEIAA
jgi:hypothetical protein